MIATKELMIGNYVKVNGRPYKVDEVFANAVGLEKWDTLFHESELEPIPITKELLVKNEFRIKWHCDNIWECYSLVSEYSIRIIDDGVLSNVNTLTLCVESNLIGIDVQVRYIHQLENLMSILGIELELEL